MPLALLLIAATPHTRVAPTIQLHASYAPCLPRPSCARTASKEVFTYHTLATLATLATKRHSPPHAPTLPQVRALLLRALAPLLVIIIVPLVGIAITVALHLSSSRVAIVKAQYLSAETSSTSTRNAAEAEEDGRRTATVKAAVLRGLLNCLPLSLIISFCFTPTVSRRAR